MVGGLKGFLEIYRELDMMLNAVGKFHFELSCVVTFFLAAEEFLAHLWRLITKKRHEMVSLKLQSLDI